MPGVPSDAGGVGGAAVGPLAAPAVVGRSTTGTEVGAGAPAAGGVAGAGEFWAGEFWAVEFWAGDCEPRGFTDAADWGDGFADAAPQAGQKRAPSGNPFPHFTQNMLDPPIGTADRRRSRYEGI